MTDSVQVFHPGWRFVDALGVPYSGAKMVFYDAGTSNTRTVYSNSGLSSSLGSTVYTGSDGAPVASSGSSTEVMVYTGTSAYKIVFTTSADVEIFTLDNIRGALDTSTFLTTDSTSTLTIPVSSKTGDYTIVAGDRGKLINADASSATFTLTLTSAVTLGDNWSILVRNTGTANPVKIAASQAISGPWASVGSTNSFALRPGEGAFINCNGVTFQISAMAPAYMAGTVGVIEIADRVSAAPGSPVAGARYIVSGAFSTYEQEDIIEADGAGGFFEITLPTDCGWIAYVQDENAYYAFQDSAWTSRFGGALGTYTALSSTATTFTGIPTGARMVVLNIVGMSWDNTATVRIRIGPSGGVATSGYLSANATLQHGAAVVVTAGTAGFDASSIAASGVYNGQLIFTLADSATNTWTCQGQLAQSAITIVHQFAGSVPLSGALERISITTVAGTAAIDAGSASVLVYQ
jgi:hypothetical protein